MSLQTNLTGRVRNTNLPKSHGLMPVFEAVVNSIHAIEETGSLNDGYINLEINREQNVLTELESELNSPITGFTISDNGCGFNDQNMASFKMLDTDYKMDKGCRGLGRLIWLKVFDQADISSSFYDDKGKLKERFFIFSSKNSIHNDYLKDSESKCRGTTITLKGFDKKYRDSVARTLSAIADNLLEHILWYFVREGSAPTVVITDGTEKIVLSDLFDKYMKDTADIETITIKDMQFDLTHIKFRQSVRTTHKLAWCASNRLVKEESIKDAWIAGLYGSLEDDTGEFYYTCYITSPYLTERVRSERTGFNIEENFTDMMDEISFRTLRNEVLLRCAEYLSSYLLVNIEAGKERVERFVSSRAPRYKSILHRIDQSALIVDPKMPDDKLDLHLHAQLYKIESQILSEGHALMQPTEIEELDGYRSRLNNYLLKVEDIKKSDLANYVSHRKVVIDLLRKSVEHLTHGKYEKEHVIHELIMPMRADTDTTDIMACNLWLIDERLAFHHYLASDKTINSMPITEGKSNLEPDLLSLKVFDNPILVSSDSSPALASITVIEIKRPMRNDVKEDKDPIDQTLTYLEKVREGKVKTKNGRPIFGSQDLPGYCYILCDLTPTMQKRCKQYNLMRSADGMGFFGYNQSYKAYIEVISFDQLVKSATERNSAFFSQLGIPSI